MVSRREKHSGHLAFSCCISSAEYVDNLADYFVVDSLSLTGVAFLLSEVVEDLCLTAWQVYTSHRILTEPGLKSWELVTFFPFLYVLCKREWQSMTSEWKSVSYSESQSFLNTQGSLPTPFLWHRAYLVGKNAAITCIQLPHFCPGETMI